MSALTEPLRLESLSKTYGGKQVLRDLNLILPNTGIVALMGPSGCGKTTLLRIIAGLDRPDAGSVRIPQDAVLSMVFQEDRLLPTLTALENILVVLGGDTAHNRQLAHRCLADCQLEGESDKYPAQLSGGMRRRVSIARALAYGGDLLLLDEPFKGLDTETKLHVMDFALSGHTRSGALTVLVTHDREEAQKADEIYEFVGPPMQFLE